MDHPYGFSCFKKGRILTMKNTGIIRKIDDLGRITIPIEIRRNLELSVNDALEIFVQDDQIVLQKYEPADIFTGERKDLIEFEGKRISRSTVESLAKLAGIIE